MKRTIINLFTYYAMLVLVVGCISGGTPWNPSLPIVSDDKNAQDSSPYPIEPPPIPIDSITSDKSYPIETQQPDQPGSTNVLDITPIRQSDFGVVLGNLLSLLDKKPLSGVKIYAAEKVPIRPGDGYVITLQEKSSPQAVTNVNGQFVIESIPPNEYVLMFITPFSNHTVLDASNEEIHLSILGGDLFDLGRVYVNWP